MSFPSPPLRLSLQTVVTSLGSTLRTRWLLPNGLAALAFVWTKARHRFGHEFYILLRSGWESEEM